MQILVGKHDDSPVFAFDFGDNRCSSSNPSKVAMATAWLTIQNGQVIYSQCKGIIFYADSLIDTIYVNGDRFGRSQGGRPVYTHIRTDEIIKELQYGRETGGSGRLCEMTVITNIDTYHVNTGADRHCGADRYSVFVEDNEDFFSFLNLNIIFNGDDWIVGFKNERLIL